MIIIIIIIITIIILIIIFIFIFIIIIIVIIILLTLIGLVVIQKFGIEFDGQVVEILIFEIGVFEKDLNRL